MLSALVALALAGSPVVVLEKNVGPYRVAAQAAEQHLPGAVEVSPDDPNLADKLKDAPVVVAVGRPSLKAARGHVSAKPVVFCMVLGVTRADLSGMVTGVPLEPSPNDLLHRIRAVVPSAKKVGVIYDPHESGYYMERAKTSAGAEGLTLYVAPVASGSEARDAVDAMQGKIDALWLPANVKLFSPELSSYILAKASENRLPLFGFLESYTIDGALGAVSSNYADAGDRAGQLAADIAAKPEGQRLPVPPPTYAPGDLSLNLKTAQALGIDVPQVAVAGAIKVVR
jgi:putative tryptophan/tyrosine transport system substrate-binding protein